MSLLPVFWWKSRASQRSENVFFSDMSAVTYRMLHICGPFFSLKDGKVPLPPLSSISIFARPWLRHCSTLNRPVNRESERLVSRWVCTNLVEVFFPPSFGKERRSRPFLPRYRSLFHVASQGPPSLFSARRVFSRGPFFLSTLTSRVFLRIAPRSPYRVDRPLPPPLSESKSFSTLSITFYLEHRQPRSSVCRSYCRCSRMPSPIVRGADLPLSLLPASFRDWFFRTAPISAI